MHRNCPLHCYLKTTHFLYVLWKPLSKVASTFHWSILQRQYYINRMNTLYHLTLNVYPKVGQPVSILYKVVLTCLAYLILDIFRQNFVEINTVSHRTTIDSLFTPLRYSESGCYFYSPYIPFPNTGWQDYKETGAFRREIDWEWCCLLKHCWLGMPSLLPKLHTQVITTIIIMMIIIIIIIIIK